MFIMKYFNAQFRWTFKVYVHITVGKVRVKFNGVRRNFIIFMKNQPITITVTILAVKLLL